MHVLSGPDNRDPSSLPNDGRFRSMRVVSLFKDKGRIAYAGNFAKIVPVDPEVEILVKSAVATRFEHGFTIEEDCFDASDIKEIVTEPGGLEWLLAMRIDLIHIVI